MEEPVINCPECKAEIKLTETLAGPLVAATRKEFEEEAAKRELAIKQREEEISKAQKSINEQVSKTLEKERIAIVAEESKKAKQISSLDLDAKEKELASLKEVLEQRDTKFL